MFWSNNYSIGINYPFKLHNAYMVAILNYKCVSYKIISPTHYLFSHFFLFHWCKIQLFPFEVCLYHFYFHQIAQTVAVFCLDAD